MELVQHTREKWIKTYYAVGVEEINLKKKIIVLKNLKKYINNIRIH